MPVLLTVCMFYSYQIDYPNIIIKNNIYLIQRSCGERVSVSNGVNKSIFEVSYQCQEFTQPCGWGWDVINSMYCVVIDKKMSTFVSTIECVCKWLK